MIEMNLPIPFEQSMRQLLGDRVIVFCETPAEKRLHDRHGDFAGGQLVVKILRVEVAPVDLFRVAPVDVIHLNQTEIPFVPVVIPHAPLENLRVAVERKTEIPYPSGSAQFDAPVKRSVLEITFRKSFKIPVPDRMQKIIVDVFGLKFPEGLLEHLFAFLKRMLRRREIRRLIS